MTTTNRIRDAVGPLLDILDRVEVHCELLAGKLSQEHPARSSIVHILEESNRTIQSLHQTLHKNLYDDRRITVGEAETSEELSGLIVIARGNLTQANVDLSTLLRMWRLHREHEFDGHELDEIPYLLKKTCWNVELKMLELTMHPCLYQVVRADWYDLGDLSGPDYEDAEEGKIQEAPRVNGVSRRIAGLPQYDGSYDDYYYDEPHRYQAESRAASSSMHDRLNRTGPHELVEYSGGRDPSMGSASGGSGISFRPSAYGPREVNPFLERPRQDMSNYNFEYDRDRLAGRFSRGRDGTYYNPDWQSGFGGGGGGRGSSQMGEEYERPSSRMSGMSEGWGDRLRWEENKMNAGRLQRQFGETGGYGAPRRPFEPRYRG